MAASRLNLLGGFDLDCGGGKPMAGAPRKVKALLAYLALEPDTPHPREKLATLLWEASGEQQARQSLRQALADLRKVLPGENTLIASSEAVTLAHDAIEVDAIELARLSGSKNAESLEQAVALYRGELLEGFNARAPAFDDWLALERNRIREQGLTAMASLLEHSLARGANDRAISLALRILALDPLREPTHRALMQLYAKQGRYGSALKQYEICRSVLARELGVAPEQETTALFRDLAESRKHSPRSGGACGGLLPFEKGAMREVSSETGAALPRSSTAENPLDPSKRHSELRQVTVLAVVIAEFAATASRLEPDELRECLNRYYGIADGETKRYGGVITKHADDSVISVFGLPAAESSDTERAVRAAAAIQREIAALRASATPPLRIRIGIASGKVMTDELGSAHYRERSIIGHCVTLAEDLAQTAAPDEIVIADEAYHGVAARFSGSQLLASALPKSVSGGAWRLGVERLVAERSFVGRQRERSAFASALEACRTTQCGQAFLVRGDAGIGKSRLLEEFEAIAKSSGFVVHKALVLDFGISFGQDAVRALVKSLLQLSLASPPDELRAAAEPGDRGRPGRAGSPGFSRRFTRLTAARSIQDGL
jgi:DNA-binding SARP family transcriptional activator/class 3 adenylate cyclase